MNLTRESIKLARYRLRREVEKKWGGYISEANLYFHALFRTQKEPSVKFVILSYQRTGSSLLVDLLNSHPLIHCEGEILLNRMRRPRKFIDIRSKLCVKPAYGFKLLTPHFIYQNINDPIAFTDYLYESGYKIIALKRRNLLRSALSLYFAVHTGIFHRYQSIAEDTINPMVINPQELFDNVVWIEKHSKLVEKISSHHPQIEVIYERDLLETKCHQGTIDRICNFIGIAGGNVSSDMVRYIPDELRAVAANAQEIEKFFQHTPYAHYLR